MKLVFDIEANGLEDADTIHCLEVVDAHTRQTYGFNDQGTLPSIDEGIRMLNDAELIVGHNIIGYDCPTIDRIRLSKLQKKVSQDTMLMATMLWPTIIAKDNTGRYFIPRDLFGNHGLRAYGYRLGLHKGDYTGGWDKWNQEMQDYCKQDVQVTLRLYEELMKTYGTEHKDGLSPLSVEIEMDFAKLMTAQETIGVPFDADKAEALREPMQDRIEVVRKELQEIVPPKAVVLKTKTRYEPFNPGSTDQIAKYFQDRYEWKPSKFTEKGNVQMGGEILEALPFPEVPLLLEYSQLQKLLGQLSTGDKAWMKHMRNGRLHGRVDTLGTITGRCAHSNPNLGQIPASRSFMGKEVRALFHAPPGRVMVGADGKGLELRMFGHYLAPYDEGEYCRIILESDVHIKNMQAAGLINRDQAKTFIYALLYGAGDEKLGSIKLPFGTIQEQGAAGAFAKASFERNVPAYRTLKGKVKEAAKRGWIKGIDGRRLTVRSAHSALNLLLQNAGAVVMKLATNIFWRHVEELGLDVQPALHIHDEFQVMALPDDAHIVGKLMCQSIEEAGRQLKFAMPIEGEYKVGSNWAETH